MIQSSTIVNFVDRMTASYLVRLDQYERTKWCGWDEAERIVGKSELPILLQTRQIKYIAPRKDCGKNAKWRIRRLDCYKHVKPVEGAIEILANNI